MSADRFAWQDDAACLTVPNFTEQRPSVQKQRCAGCPVKWQCLELGNEVDADYADVADSNGSNKVVYGGLTLPERAELRRRATLQIYTDRRKTA